MEPSTGHKEEPRISASEITFGPPGMEWTYTPATKTYDLTRGLSEHQFCFTPSRGPEGISVNIAPKSTALVVIDMQNYFLHPECRVHETGLAAVNPTLRVANKCREVGIKVIWLNWGLTDQDIATMPAATLSSFAGSSTSPPLTPNSPISGFGIDMGSSKGRCLMLNSWNAELYNPLYTSYQSHSQNDILCPKTRVSGLWSQETPFARVLRENEFKTLLFAGVNTNQCVLGTLLDCYYQGYDCVMVEDCCATTTLGAQEMCVRDVSRGYGFVVDAKRFTEGKVD